MSRRKKKKFKYSSVCCCLILLLFSLVLHKMSCDTSLYISQIYSSKKQIEWPFLSIKGRSASCVSCAFSVFLAFHKYVCVNSLKRSLRFVPRPKIKPVAEWTGLAQTPESQSEPPGLTCNPGITTGSTWNNEPSDRMQLKFTILSTKCAIRREHILSRSTRRNNITGSNWLMLLQLLLWKSPARYV